tara:strand:- start:98 stop:523 length:426 start_codon:yes stop_codon:yes gene_type:complete
MDMLKLNDLKMDAEFLNALGELEQRIIEDYDKFMDNPKMRKEFRENLHYIPGRKYLKIVTDNSVWGFINLSNPKFLEGDILKAAGWKTPALNQARGNIFNIWPPDNYTIAWTGPLYISGYSAGGTRKCGECGAPIKTLLGA